MDQSKSRGKRAWGFEPQEESQLPISADLANASALNHQRATGNMDAVDGGATGNAFDGNTDKVQVAQAAIGYRPKHHQDSNMDSVKELLRIFLDDVKEPQAERSSYFDGLLSQWLDTWRTNRTDPLLIYILGERIDQYRDGILDISDLDTIDKIKTDFIEQQCSQKGICLYLSKMTSAINRDPDHALEVKMAICLHEIRDFSGGLLVNKPVAVMPESIIQTEQYLKERYHGTVPDDSVAQLNPYPSPSGGSPALRNGTAKSFQDWVLVLMPEGHRFKFLTDNADTSELHDWIKTQSAEIRPSELDLPGTDTNLRWGLASACKTQLNNIATFAANLSHSADPESYDRQGEMLEAVFSASLVLRDPDIFGTAVIWNPRMLSLEKWKEVGSSIEAANFMSYRISLNQALTKIDSFQDRFIILQCVREGFQAQTESQEHMQMISDWVRDQIEQALSDVQRVEENDGAILVLVVKEFATALNIHRITSFAKRHMSHHSFAIEFAFSLYDKLVKNAIDEGQAKYLLAEILSAAVPSLCVRAAHSWSLQPWSSTRTSNPSTQEQHFLRADRMARLIRCCLTVSLYNEEHSLLRHFWLDASIADAPTLQHIFLPYLKQLLVVMHDHAIPLTTPNYQWQFQQVISLFITRYIGKEPTPSPSVPDLTCPPLGCASPADPYGCATCRELDAFLVDPHLRTADVTGGIDAPEHVAARIQGTDRLQMTVMAHSAEQMTSTIRVSKNQVKTEETDARHDLWIARVVAANDSIQAVCGDEEWKLLLGERYDDCMGLKVVRSG